MAWLTDKTLGLARRGDIEGVQQALEADPALIGASGPHSRSLLWEAVRYGREDLVDYLLNQGAPVDAPGRHRAESYVLLSPLCVALWRKRKALAAKLEAAGAALSLYDAAFLGDVETVRTAVEADPQVIDRPLAADEFWQTMPLHFAASGEQVEVARYLCQQGPDMAAQGPLLLDIAARRGNRELVELFLAAGAEARHAKAFAALVGGNGAELIPLLAAQGLDVNQDEFGYPPLIYCSRGDKGEHPEWIELLLAHGARVDIRDRKGRTALHAAAAAGFCRVGTVLLEAGADVNAEDAAGQTPLQQARRKKRQAMIALLEGRGAR